MWVEMLMYLVFLLAIDLSSQSEKGGKGRVKTEYTESIIPDSDHGHQIHSEMSPYEHTAIEASLSESKQTRNSRKRNVLPEEVKKARRAEFDQKRRMERSKQYKAQLAEFHPPVQLPPEYEPIVFDDPEEAKKFDKDVRKFANTEKRRIANRQKAITLKKQLDERANPPAVQTQAEVIHNTYGSSSSSEQGYPLLQPNQYNNQFYGYH